MCAWMVCAIKMSFLEAMMRTTGYKKGLSKKVTYQTFVILEAITKVVALANRIPKKLELTIDL